MGSRQRSPPLPSSPTPEDVLWLLAQGGMPGVWKLQQDFTSRVWTRPYGKNPAIVHVVITKTWTVVDLVGRYGKGQELFKRSRYGKQGRGSLSLPPRMRLSGSQAPFDAAHHRFHKPRALHAVDSKAAFAPQYTWPNGPLRRLAGQVHPGMPHERQQHR